MPKTQRWSEIAGSRAESSLLAIRARLAMLADVSEVQRAMTFLISLPIASRSPDPVAGLCEMFGIRLVGEPTAGPLRVAVELWIPGDEAGARVAAIRAVDEFLAGRPKAGGLFGDDPWQVWRELDGSPFCELGRLFFAFLLERVMLDSLGLNAYQAPGSPSPTPPSMRSHFEGGALTGPSPQPLSQDKPLGRGASEVRLHAFETSLIVQPFVARWYNAQVRGKLPDAGNVRWFLAHSFGKLDLEIERELGGHPIVRSRSAHRQDRLEGFG